MTWPRGLIDVSSTPPLLVEEIMRRHWLPRSPDENELRYGD